LISFGWFNLPDLAIAEDGDKEALSECNFSIFFEDPEAGPDDKAASSY